MQLPDATFMWFDDDKQGCSFHYTITGQWSLQLSTVCIGLFETAYTPACSAPGKPPCRQAPLPAFLSSEGRSAVTPTSWGAEPENRYSPILQWHLDANPTPEGVKSHLLQGASLCRSSIKVGVTHLKSLKGLKDLPVIWDRELNMHLPNPRAYSPAGALPWPQAGRHPPMPQHTGLHHAVRRALASTALPASLGSCSCCQECQGRISIQQGDDELTF